MSDNRLITPEKRGEDVDATLRPQRLDDFVGQAAARANLKIFIEAAKTRGEALDHVLFVGPPGLGKTTLAVQVCRRLEAEFPWQAMVSVSQAFKPSRDLKVLLKDLLQQVIKPKISNDRGI